MQQLEYKSKELEELEQELLYNVVQSFIEALRESIYPPESRIEPSAIKRIEQREKEVKAHGETVSFSEFKRRVLKDVQNTD